MKKVEFSEIFRGIIITSVILIAALLSVRYNINFNGYVKKVNGFLNNDNILSSKKEVSLVKCVDGDTAKVKLGNKLITIRFLAIDTPETVHPYKTSEPYGRDASTYSCHLLENAKVIKIAYEKGLTSQDKYHRDLVWVWTDNILIQEELIKTGYAQVKYLYAKYKYTDKLLKLQKEAQINKIGIWHNYHEILSNNEMHLVTFKYGDTSKRIEAENGSLVDIISNPSKQGYTFTGWKYHGKLYDLSIPVTEDITLQASFSK